MSRTKNAIVNTIFGSLQKVLQMLLPFVMRSIMLHTLGIGYLGLNGLFTSVLQTLSIAELGIAGAITYNMYLPIARKDTDQVGRLLRLYRILYAVIGLTILLLGAALLPFLPKLISGEVPEDINIYVLYLMYLVSTAMSYSLFSYRSSLLEAHQQNNIISKVNIVTTLIQFILQVICLLLFRNYYLYIMLQFAMQLVNQIIVYFCSRRLYPEIRPVGKLDKQTVSNIFRNVKGLISGRIAGIILHSSDTIVISMFLGLAVLVVYQNYFFILTAITGIISTLLQGSLAGIGNSLVTETPEKNYHDFQRFTFILSWIVCVCSCCFLALFQPFMTLWMGSENLLPMSMVVLFCVYFVLYEYNDLLNLYKAAAGLWHEDRFRPLVTALTNLGLNIFLVQRIGVYGIIGSTIISTLFVGMPWLLYNLFTLLFRRQFSGYLKALLQYAAVTLVSCLLTHACTAPLHLRGIPALFVHGIIAVCIHCCCYVLIFRKSLYFKDALMLAKRICRR